MALMLAICRPQPNWIPKNPRFMFQIWAKRSRGFSMGGSAIDGYRARRHAHFESAVAGLRGGRGSVKVLERRALRHLRTSQGDVQDDFARAVVEDQIGRASCRERAS